MTDILEKLDDLHHQATTERSHYYVGKVIKDAVFEIVRLRIKLKLLQDRKITNDTE